MRKFDVGDGSVIVTFEFRPGWSIGRVAVCGDFNSWNEEQVLDRSDDGHHSLSLRLPPGRHEFRYLLDGTVWTNDADADDFAMNPFGGLNSVVDTAMATAPRSTIEGLEARWVPTRVVSPITAFDPTVREPQSVRSVASA
jgi:hypothetical protein